MAKISARGATEISRWRLTREEGRWAEYLIRSDLRVLSRSSYVSSYDGKRETTGWSVDASKTSKLRKIGLTAYTKTLEELVSITSDWSRK